GHGEVRQRDAIARPGPARVDPELGPVGVRLDAGALAGAARLQRNAEHALPEALRAPGVVGRELDQRQGRPLHRRSVSPRVPSDRMLSLDDVLAARERIGGRLARTPTFTSRSLGPRVWLKAELFQPTGSFKVRGVLSKLATLSAEERARGVIGIS